MAGTYHRTSVESARARLDTVTMSRVGQKRTFGDYRAVPLDSGTRKTGLSKAASQSGDAFVPLTAQTPCLKSLKASEIYNILQSSSSDAGPSEYSQRRALALTPTSTSDPLLNLAHPRYELPGHLVQNLEHLGIKSIYPWQSECLLKSGALCGKRNLVYTAPTGGGKSLVADIIMLKRVIENPEKKALLVLPYVALVQEKLRWLRKVTEGIVKSASGDKAQKTTTWLKRGDEETIRVAGFFGGSKSKASWSDMDIAVCTIEKANSLVNATIEDLTIGKLGVVVIDELHMIDDDSRGYILELMATKILTLDEKVQLVGMSATLNNTELLARWLGNARFFVSKYRPVPVEEFLVFDQSIWPASGAKMFHTTATQLNAPTSATQKKVEPVRIIQASEHREFSNTLVNAVVALANETARAGYGALVFCSSRAGCERDAGIISQVLPCPEEVQTDVMDKRMDLLNELRSTSNGLDHILAKTIPAGVAFHHAGLTTEERELIATAFDEGTIKVVVATCSLAAGINLPARRVIMHGARMGAELVGPAMLRQMRGRAGRKGKDEVGETYLCCQRGDLEQVAELMEAEIPDVKSCLLSDKRGIKRALLEVIATKLATSNESINDYMQKTLLFHSMEHKELQDMVRSAILELQSTKLIATMNGCEYKASLLGQAIVASSLSPDDGLFVHRELQKALGAFVMDGDLHALYIFTPIRSAIAEPNWQIFRKEIECLDERGLKVMAFVGVKPSVINKMAEGGSMKESTEEEIETARIYRRFYTAFQLRDLCNEIPVDRVSRKFEIPRGMVQNLSQTCHGFAAGMIKFCERMGWGALAAVLDHFSDRLRAGAKADLLSLAQISFVKSRTARVFWENGFKTVAAVAVADVKDILPVLLMAQPKKLKVDQAQEQKYQEKLLSKAAQISKSANIIWELQMQQEIFDEE